MAEITLYTKFKLRRGTSEAWARVNPVLSYGEPGFEKDTNKLKIGDGVKAWNQLPYLTEDFKISADGKSVTYQNNQLGLYGYESAKMGQFPIKGENNLEWIDQAKSISNEEIISICRKENS